MMVGIPKMIQTQGITLHFFDAIIVLPQVSLDTKFVINVINVLNCLFLNVVGTRDWQNAAIGPKQGNLLCFECRSYNKKYGELPPTPQSPAECPSPTTSDVTVTAESPSRMRTRNKSKETVYYYCLL